MRPTDEEINIFINTFDKLANFEVRQRVIRSYGAFTEDDIENIQQSCIKVIEWLKQQISETT